MSKSEFHRADEKRFLDERGGSGPLAPNGLNPATIMEKAVRERIVESYFYKEQCYGVNEADIVDRVVEHVDFIGGTYGIAQKPSPFLCLAFKLLQLAPNDAVLDEYLRFGGDKFKYLRALAAFYIRLTRADKDVYATLEPLLEDRRKLRRKGRAGTSLTFVDEFVDNLLTEDRVCATTLWKMRKRDILEDLELLEPRVSPLGNIEDLLEEEEQREKDEAERKAAAENGHDDSGSRGSSSDGSVRSASRSRSRSRSTRRTRSRSDSRSRSRSRSRRRTRSQSDSRSRSRRRSRSASQSRPPSRSRSRSRSGEEGEVSDHDRMDVDRPERRGPGEPTKKQEDVSSIVFK